MGGENVREGRLFGTADFEDQLSKLKVVAASIGSQRLR
jgi:hypothetical protein